MKSNKPDMTSFEKDIKQIFSGHEFMPNTEAMWGNIAPHIKRRDHGFTWLKFFKLFMTVALVLFVSFSALNYFGTDLTKHASASETSSATGLKTSLPDEILPDNNPSNEKSIGLLTDEKQNNHIDNSKLNKTKNNILEAYTNNEQKTKSNDHIINSKSVQKNISNNSIKVQDNNISYNPRNDNKGTKNQISESFLIESLMDTKPFSKDDVAYKTTSKNNQSNIPTLLNTNSANLLGNVSSITDNSILSRAGLLSINILKMPQAFEDIGLIKENVDLYKRKWKKVRRKHGCYDFSLRKWRNEIDVYIGPDWTKKYLDAKSSRFEKNAETRIKTEKSLEAFSIGIQYNLRHRSGFYGSIGLNYSQIDEKFELNTLSSDSTIRKGVIRIDIDSSGKKTETIGDVENQDIITWDKVTYNYYRFLSIPVTLGYGFSFYGFGIEPSIGIDFNFLFLKKGEVLDARSSVIAIDNITSNHPKKADVFKSSVGFSGVGALKIVYPYSSRMDFFGETYVRYQLKPITVDDYPLDQKYRTIGVRLGARFKF